MNTCPTCDSTATRVLESKKTNTGGKRRRHECKACGHRWTSWEGDRPLRHGAARWGYKPEDVITWQHRNDCTNCQSWSGVRCRFGFPDPLVEGTSFAQECVNYATCGGSSSSQSQRSSSLSTLQKG